MRRYLEAQARKPAKSTRKREEEIGNCDNERADTVGSLSGILRRPRSDGDIGPDTGACL